MADFWDEGRAPSNTLTQEVYKMRMQYLDWQEAIYYLTIGSIISSTLTALTLIIVLLAYFSF